MFLSQLKTLNNKSVTIPSKVTVEELSSEERDLLQWFILIKNKNKANVDALGVEVFGPHYFYTYVNSLQKKGFLHLLEISHIQAYYAVLREIDEEISLSQQSRAEISDNNRSEKDDVYFDITSFLKQLMIYINSSIHGADLNEENETMNRLFASVLKKIDYEYEKKVFFHQLQISPDDFLEYIVSEFLEETLQQKNKKLTTFFTKKLLYGFPIDSDDLTVVMPPFSYNKPKSLITGLEQREDNLNQAIPLHGGEWLIPTNLSLSLLWKVMVFSKVISVGQTFHVSFTSKSVQGGKEKGVDYSIWLDVVNFLPISEKERTSFLGLWENVHPITQKSTFTFYQFQSESLKRHMYENAKIHLGDGQVMENEHGLFIMVDAINKWENLLKSNSIAFGKTSTANSQNKQESIREVVHLLPPANPREWEEVDRLPTTMFQLMTYKENMIARLLRQSQALKLPVVIEGHGEPPYSAEIKTIHFHAENATAETYVGNKINIHNIRRIALVHPDEKSAAYPTR